jgi:hypothetical protein
MEIEYNLEKQRLREKNRVHKLYIEKMKKTY